MTPNNLLLTLVIVPEGFIAGIVFLAFLLIFGVLPGYVLGYRHGVRDTREENEDGPEVIFANPTWPDSER